MTRDEILNTPAGREMDKLIAEKFFGWRWFPCGNGGRAFRVTEDHKWGVREFADKTLHYSDQLPRYSTDIAAAWQVVELMRTKRNLLIRVGILPNGFFTVDFFMRDGVVTAETAPLAICRAALLAVTGGEQ